MTIKDIVRKMVENEIGQKEPIYCTVKSVDDTEKTCVASPVNGDPDILDVRLIGNNGNGIFLKPAVDSIVAVVMVDEFVGFVALYSQLESITIGDGSFNGLIKIDNLVTRLNTIESDINDIKTAFTNWTPVANDGGAALKTAASSWSGSQLTETVKGDIENPNVTHGNL